MSRTAEIVLLVEQLSTERLLSCVSFDAAGEFEYTGEEFLKLKSDLVGSDYINPLWLSARIAEALYNRGVYDEEQMWKITDD